MFNFDDDEMDRVVIRFTYNQYDDEGNTVARVERIIRNDEAEYLPSILSAFRYFLQGMTYTYIDNVVAVSEKGKEFSSEDSL